MECHVLFRSVGYRGVAIPGVPFDDRRGVIPNRGERVVTATGNWSDVLYVATAINIAAVFLVWFALRPAAARRHLKD